MPKLLILLEIGLCKPILYYFSPWGRVTIFLTSVNGGLLFLGRTFSKYSGPPPDK